MALVKHHLITFPLHKLLLIRTVLQRYAWIASKVADGRNVATARREVIEEQRLGKDGLPAANRLSGMCKEYLREVTCFVFDTEEMPLLCVRNGKGEAKGLTEHGLAFLGEVESTMDHLRTRAHPAHTA